MSEKKEFTQEQIEEIKKAAVAEALAAQQTANAESSGDSDNTDDGGKKSGFKDKAKEAFDKFWNFSITPKKIATAVVIGGAAFLGFRCAYNKGRNDAMSEAEFNGQAELPDNNGPLALETAEPEAIEATFVEDDATEEVYEE